MTKKRYCDFCGSEIKKGESFVRLSQVNYATKDYITHRGVKKTYQVYPQKTIGDMCLKCKNKLNNKK